MPGVRVAVIDSGVNPRHPHITGCAGGIAISSTGNITKGDILDRLGHGTAVMAAIQDKAGDAKSVDYFAVKVFHDALRTSARCLARGMEWAIDEKMDIVNLSLGTSNQKHVELFAPLIERALEAGITIVSAHEHYPGCMPGVVGVMLGDSYRVEEEIHYATGYPRSARGIPAERNLQGISFAVANVTGHLIKSRTA
jgi:hypothetical protein